MVSDLTGLGRVMITSRSGMDIYHEQLGPRGNLSGLSTIQKYLFWSIDRQEIQSRIGTR